MKNQLLNSAKRTLKTTAAASFGLCLAVSSFAQTQPVHAIHHPVEVLNSTERGNGDSRPQAEIEVSILTNPSPTGIFTVMTVEGDLSIQVYNESLTPIRVDIENVRPGHYVIDMSKKDNGIYTMVVTSDAGQSLRELIKREALSDGATSSDNKLKELQVSISNPTIGIFTVETDEENAVIQVLNEKMRPISAPISNQLSGMHRIDLTNHTAGVYYVQVRTKTAMATEQIVNHAALSNGALDTEKLMELQISVFPNPTTGIFTVQTEGGNAVIQMFDRTMNPINAPINQQLSERHTIDLTNFQSGVYYVQVRTKTAMATEKIMKR